MVDKKPEPQSGEMLVVGANGQMTYQPLVSGSPTWILQQTDTTYGPDIPSLDPRTYLEPLHSILVTVYVLYEASQGVQIRKHVTDNWDAARNWGTSPSRWYEIQTALDVNGAIVLIERVTKLSNA